MNKGFLYIIFVLPVLLFSQQKTFQLKGKVNTTNEFEKATIFYLSKEKGFVFKSFEIENGNFEFEGKLEEPVKADVYLQHGASGLNPKAADKISVYLDMGLTQLISETDSIYSAKVLGSKRTMDYAKLQNALIPTNKKIAGYYREFAVTVEEGGVTQQAKALLEKKEQAVVQEQKLILVQFIKENPYSIISIDALKTLQGPFPDLNEIEPLYNGLSPAVKNSDLGEAFSESLEKMRATSLNVLAPDFSQKDVSGNTVSLSDYKGKYVLVDFWASWCGPCRKENPNVLKAYTQFHPIGLEILAVSLDTDKTNWLNAIAKDKLPWKQVSDLKGWENEVALLYGVKAIPQNVLIDPSGKIIAKNLRDEDLISTLKNILKNR